MKRSTKILNSIITILATTVSLFVVVHFCMTKYVVTTEQALIRFFAGAIISGFLHALAHEIGHLVEGKDNGFTLSEMVVWFFRWKKIDNKVRFGLVMMGDEAGYTQMIPVDKTKVENGLKKMTKGGVSASICLTFVGLIPFFIQSLPAWALCVWSMLFPVGVYYVLGNALPKECNGVYNDGAILLAIKKKDDYIKVMINLLKIQAELYCGKTPAQIDYNLYFNLPQIAEDKLPFAMLLSARYYYYLDKLDYENAKKTTERLLMIEEYLSKENILLVKADELYNCCTFDYNEDRADDLTYELEKYLNEVNSATNIRIKLAYLVYVVKNKSMIDAFVEKGIREAKKHQIKGIGLMEEKLLTKIKEEA